MWVQSNAAQLLATDNKEETLNLVWPLLTEHVHNNTFKKFDKPDVLKEITKKWIEGNPFHELLETIEQRKAKMIWGTRRRKFKIDHVVEVCEGALAYDGALLIGALKESLELVDLKDTDEAIPRLELFQKQLKYGLPSDTAITLFEIGFSDRVISQELSTFIEGSDQATVRRSLQENKVNVETMLAGYPSYYTAEIYDKLV